MYRIGCEVDASIGGNAEDFRLAVKLAESMAETAYHLLGSSQYIVVKRGEDTVWAVRYTPEYGGGYSVPQDLWECFGWELSNA